MKKRMISILLALVMAVGLLPTMVMAEDNEVSYTCGGTERQGTFRQAVEQVQQAGGGTITLLKDVEVGGNIEITSNSAMTVTIHGEGHKITLTSKELLLRGNVTLNLGGTDYTKTLTITSTDPTCAILNVGDSATLNMYDHVTLGPSVGRGRPGGVHLEKNAVFNMFGGMITDCVNTASVSGAVAVTDHGTFRLKDGIIQNCSGWEGGAISIDPSYPIGDDGAESNLTFEMSGGTIRKCTDYWYGGGAICAYTAQPFTIKITGGTITGCSAVGNGYGGAVFLYGTSSTDITISNATITNNTAKYGGGIFLYKGTIQCSNAAIYNNTATTAGDDIYLNTDVAAGSIGNLPTGLKLASDGVGIDGWYLDGDDGDSTTNADPRWHIDTENNDVYAVKVDAMQALNGGRAIKAAHGELPPMYIVSFDAQDGSAVSTKTVNAGASLGDSMPEEPTREGYTFKGWNTARDGSGTEFTAETVVNADMTVYAQWEKDESGNTGDKVLPLLPVWLNTEDHVSYLVGYADGTVRPEGKITRGEVATIFFRLLTQEARSANFAQTNEFSDVTRDLWCNNAISTLSGMGIIDGYSDGTFCPNAPITRAEFAKIAIGFCKMDEASYRGTFTDVADGKWYTPYVEAAAQAGLIYGADGKFRPGDNITRAEASAIVNRLLGRHPQKEHLLPSYQMINWPDCGVDAWYYADMMEATNSHSYMRMQTASYVYGSESWTGKLPQPDWTALERSWSRG